MSQRDAAAVRVHVLAAIVEPGVLQELEHDRRERLVDLHDRDVVPREPGALEGVGARLGVAMEHSVRVDPGEPEGDEARTWLQPEA
jgi:hypothetical protein